MKPGALAYKCRHCGDLFHPVHTPDGPTILRFLIDGVPLPKTWFGIPPAMIDTHLCPDGSIGVSDFVGVKLDEVSGADHGQAT